MAFLRPRQGSHEASLAPAILAKAPVVLLPVTSPAHTHNTTFQDMHTLTLACIGANGPSGSLLCHLDNGQELQSQPSCPPSQYHCFSQIGALHQSPCSRWHIHVPSERALSCVSRQFLPLLLGLPLREFRTPRRSCCVDPKRSITSEASTLLTYPFSPDYMYWRAFGCLPVIIFFHGSRSGDAAARLLANSELFLLHDDCRVSRTDPSPFHSTPRHASWRCLCGPCCVQHPCGRQWPPGSGFRRK